MLMGIYGSLGSGKTILATLQAIKFLRKVNNGKVLSNYTIKCKDCKKIELEDLLDLEDKRFEYPHLLVLDEAYSWLESRLSIQAENIYTGYFTAQSRKRNLDIIATAQLRSSIDLRFRYLEDITCYAFPRLINSKNNFEYCFMNDFNKVNYTLLYGKAKFLFDKYDTYEIVLSRRFNELKEKILYNNPHKIKEKLEVIINKYQESGINLVKITHDSVKDMLIEIEEPLILEPYVYSRLKAHSDEK